MRLRTSPGNGHDLACTSGLAVASAIGADYPLQDEEARRDAGHCAWTSLCFFGLCHGAPNKIHQWNFMTQGFETF